MPLASQTLVEMDVSTDIQRRTISPNSTLSSSDIGSVGFNSDEQPCIHPALESDNTMTETPSNSFYNGVSFCVLFV